MHRTIQLHHSACAASHQQVTVMIKSRAVDTAGFTVQWKLPLQNTIPFFHNILYCSSFMPLGHCIFQTKGGGCIKAYLDHVILAFKSLFS